MNDIDDKIKAALSAEDQDIFEAGEPGLRELVAETFRGKLRFFTWLTWTFVLVFFALQVVSAVLFFRTDNLQEKILWSTTFLFFALGVAMLKVWNWMQMDKVALIREMKRLELQIARLGVRRS